MTNDIDTGELLLKRDFAKPLGVTIDCVNKWVSQRKIASVKIGGLVRIPASELNRIIQEGFRPAKPARQQRNAK